MKININKINIEFEDYEIKDLIEEMDKLNNLPEQLWKFREILRSLEQIIKHKAGDMEK